MPSDRIDRVLTRLNDWLAKHENSRPVRTINAAGRVSEWAWLLLMVLVGAAIAGYALGQGVLGFIFAAVLALGAYLMLKHGRPE